MIMFENEEGLKALIEQKKNLLWQVLNDEIQIDTFFMKYDSFYFTYALDGHESDEEEKDLLLKYSTEIEIFRKIELEIFCRICSDEDSQKEIYVQNDRISKSQAIGEIKEKRSELGF